MWHPGMDVRRWDGTVAFRLAADWRACRFVEVASSAALVLDDEGRVLGMDWSDEAEAPRQLRPAVVIDPAHERATVWLTDARAAASTVPVIGCPVRALLDEDGRVVGLEVADARDRLPPRLLEALAREERPEAARADEADKPDEADEADEADEPVSPPDRVPIPDLPEPDDEDADHWLVRHRRPVNLVSAAVISVPAGIGLSLAGETLAIALVGGAAIFVTLLLAVALLSRAERKPIVLVPRVRWWDL